MAFASPAGGGNGFTFLDQAFDTPDAPIPELTQPSAAPPIQHHPQQPYGAPAPGAGAPRQLSKQQQQQLEMVSMIMGELVPFIQHKDKQHKEHQEQLYSMVISKQSEASQSAAASITKYCSSLEILLFVVIGCLVVLGIIQIVMCQKVAQLAKK